MTENLPGLTCVEVDQRVAAGQVNTDVSVKTKSIKRIVRDNIFTLFNLINVILCLFVLITGSYKNALFMGVIVCNTLIGIVQEVRSKKTTDKLSIIAASKATVIREGEKQEIPLEQIVQDDLVELGRGDQIPADSVVVRGSCDANESLLTGESKLIKKTVNSELMSGSFVNSGTVVARVVHVGADNYAAKISAEAKQHKKINSEIMNSLNGIIKFVSIIIFPLGAALFARQFFLDNVPLNDAILSSTAALVGMIPEGLILLTSTVLAVSVVRLAKSQVLVQQLYCIETLARVDTLCLDKTGTITTGKMEVDKVEAIVTADYTGVQSEIDAAFASLVACDEDPNE
ncbi:MAG: HAD-IC family P-type ATPase, partial [Raoultibacter sp.]